MMWQYIRFSTLPHPQVDHLWPLTCLGAIPSRQVPFLWIEGNPMQNHESFFKVNRQTYLALDKIQRDIYVNILSRLNDHNPDYCKYGIQVPPGACVATSGDLSADLGMGRDALKYALKKMAHIFRIKPVKCETPGRRAMMIYTINSPAKPLKTKDLSGKLPSQLPGNGHSPADSPANMPETKDLHDKFPSRLPHPIYDVKKSLQEEDQKQGLKDSKRLHSGKGQNTKSKTVTGRRFDPNFKAHATLAKKVFPMTSHLQPDGPSIDRMIQTIIDCEKCWSLSEQEILFPMACQHNPGINNPPAYFRFKGLGASLSHPLGEQMAILAGAGSRQADDDLIRKSKEANDQISAEIQAAGFMPQMAGMVAKPFPTVARKNDHHDHKKILGLIRDRLGKTGRKSLKDIKPNDRAPTLDEIEKIAMLKAQAAGFKKDGGP